MHSLIFATGNAEKFDIARAVCEPLGIALERRSLEIDAIQGEDSEVIIRDKARKAFEIVKQPLVVNDISWEIPALNGFPGPYMKSVAHWFSADDFLNLMHPFKDRSIILVQLLAYQDEKTQRVFYTEHVGTFLQDSRGNYGISLQKVVAMPGDNGLSIAEAYDRGVTHTERDVAMGWRELAEWRKQKAAA